MIDDNCFVNSEFRAHIHVYSFYTNKKNRNKYIYYCPNNIIEKNKNIIQESEKTNVVYFIFIKTNTLY